MTYDIPTPKPVKGGLIEQPTGFPTRKMGAASGAGAVAWVCTAVAGLAGVALPPDVASAIAVVAMSVVGYLTKERAGP